MNFVLSFIWSLSYVGRALIYLEAHIPWTSIVTFLNTVGRSGVSDDRIEAEVFPQSVSGTGHQLPEDFPARGAVWAQHIFPADFFRTNVTDEDERTLELPSHTAPRCERCLWLGVRVASLDRYMHYDAKTKQFSVSEYALSLEQAGPGERELSTPSPDHTVAGGLLEPSDDHQEVEMTDVQTVGASTAGTDTDYVVIDKRYSELPDRDNDKTMTGE